MHPMDATAHFWCALDIVRSELLALKLSRLTNLRFIMADAAPTSPKASMASSSQLIEVLPENLQVSGRWYVSFANSDAIAT
jgi:hypothetical protein